MVTVVLLLFAVFIFFIFIAFYIGRKFGQREALDRALVLVESEIKEIQEEGNSARFLGLHAAKGIIKSLMTKLGV